MADEALIAAMREAFRAELRRQDVILLAADPLDDGAVIHAVLAAIEAQGWAVVPKSPTGAMIVAGAAAITGYPRNCAIGAAYRAMIAAAGDPQ